MQAFDYRRQEGQLADPDTGLVLTNFGWHYYRDRGAPPREFVVVRTMHPQYPIQEEAWDLLDRALNEYGLIVDTKREFGHISRNLLGRLLPLSIQLVFFIFPIAGSRQERNKGGWSGPRVFCAPR